MTAPQALEAQHPRFDRLTADLDEYDALPSQLSGSVDPAPHHDEDGRSEELDDQILAGLVCPY